jgi:hypothetical protein
MATASDRRYELAARADRKKKALKSRADLILSMRRQAENELKGITCGEGNAKVIKRALGQVMKQVQDTGKKPTDKNIFDAACTTCCGKKTDCKNACKEKLIEIFPTTEELKKLKEKKGKKVYESVFSDEDDLQLKF